MDRSGFDAIYSHDRKTMASFWAPAFVGSLSMMSTVQVLTSPLLFQAKPGFYATSDYIVYGKFHIWILHKSFNKIINYSIFNLNDYSEGSLFCVPFFVWFFVKLQNKRNILCIQDSENNFIFIEEINNHRKNHVIP